MIRYSDLMLGDYVLVSGTPRKVEMITKNKIGYHINPQENRLYYARLKDVEPIEITEIFVEDASNLILNRIYRIRGDMAAYTYKPRGVAFDIDNGNFYIKPPFYIHTLYHMVKSVCDNQATLSEVKTYEERRKDIDRAVKVENGKIVGNPRLCDLAEYLMAHNLHAVVYLGEKLILSFQDGRITERWDCYDLWKENRIDIFSQFTDEIETFKIHLIIDET